MERQKKRESIAGSRICRIMILLFAFVCLAAGIGKRHYFLGEQKETSIGWDLDLGITDLTDLNGDTVLQQTFYPQDTVLNYIYIGVSGHGQTGNMIVTVFDEDGKQTARTVIPCSEMVESGAQGVGFNVRVKPGQRYTYTITFEGITDEYPHIQTAHHIAVSNEENEELGPFYRDGEEQEQSLYGLFVYQSYFTQDSAWWITVIAGIVLLLYGIFYPKIPLWNTKLLPLFLVFHALISIFLLEYAAGTNLSDYVHGVDISRMARDSAVTLSGPKTILLNWMIACCIFFVLSLILWNGRLLLFVGTAVFAVIGIAEYYVLEFRGTPLVPYDLGSIRTAGAVAGNYTFDLPTKIIASVIILIALTLLETKVIFRRISLRTRLIQYACMIAFGAGTFVYLDHQPLMESKNNGRFFWVMDKSYQQYGYLLGTYLYERYQAVEKPEHYSGQAALELLDTWNSQAQADAEASNGTDGSAGTGSSSAETASYPNIIAIMNESLTDFASVGGIKTDTPNLPYIFLH